MIWSTLRLDSCQAWLQMPFVLCVESDGNPEDSMCVCKTTTPLCNIVLHIGQTIVTYLSFHFVNMFGEQVAGRAVGREIDRGTRCTVQPLCEPPSRSRVNDVSIVLVQPSALTAQNLRFCPLFRSHLVYPDFVPCSGFISQLVIYKLLDIIVDYKHWVGFFRDSSNFGHILPTMT